MKINDKNQNKKVIDIWNNNNTDYINNQIKIKK